MFRNRFEHYLSFGAADQETFRVLEGHYQGIVVPATVAVLQREGTGGFLLALSAAAARTSYVIDPRTPLYQQALPRLKRAHLDLAAILESETLASLVPVDHNGFTDARCRDIARRWVDFNEGYRDSSGGKFDKYAKRLGQAVARPQAQGPELILAPYFVASDVTDPWAQISLRMYEEATQAATTLDVLPVIATDNESRLPTIARLYQTDRAVIWVSDFNEREVDETRLIAYGESIRSLTESGSRVFALYGSYFAIAMMHLGLAGFNHGVGFGDSRDWHELPQSGPPLSRYYLYGAHRYVPPEFAQQLYALDSALVACGCAVCAGRPPLTLDYHGLMQHSVLCREQEIEAAVSSDLSTLAAAMDRYAGEYESSVNASGYAQAFTRKALEYIQHLPRWSTAFRTLA